MDEGSCRRRPWTETGDFLSLISQNERSCRLTIRCSREVAVVKPKPDVYVHAIWPDYNVAGSGGAVFPGNCVCFWVLLVSALLTPHPWMSKVISGGSCQMEWNHTSTGLMNSRNVPKS